MSTIILNNVIKLENGKYIPTIGLGTYKSEPGEVERAIGYAVDAGYRHFDCAWIYGNENDVGKGLRAKMLDGSVTREEIFVTSKLWNNFHRRELVVPMLKESLKALKLNYLDLYLIHWPIGFKEDAKTLPLIDGEAAYSDVDYVETWLGMEDCVKLGLAKSIGLSNFNSEQIDRILRYCSIKPVANQVEVNPNLNQTKLIQFCRNRGIVIIGYFPLGRSQLSGTGTPGFPDPSIKDHKIKEIAMKYHKTPAQVVLNYLLGLGVALIPKSVTKLRIEENIDVFDFVLDPEDVAYLDSCNTNERVCPLEAFYNHRYYPFNIEF